MAAPLLLSLRQNFHSAKSAKNGEIDFEVEKRSECLWWRGRAYDGLFLNQRERLLARLKHKHELSSITSTPKGSQKKVN